MPALAKESKCHTINAWGWLHNVCTPSCQSRRGVYYGMTCGQLYFPMAPVV
jgi:hypothetical protein